MRIRLPLLIVFVVPAALAAQWTPQASGTTAEFRGLVAVSPTVVWASGTRGRFARTVDGGATWMVDSVPGASGLDFRDLDASSATRAWLMAAGPAEQGQAKIVRTDDGRTWVKQFDVDTKGVFLDAISFWDNAHGIAMSDPLDGHLYLLGTENGGASWTPIPTAGTPPVLAGEAAFAASGTCLAVQGASNVWIGTGGGATSRVFHSRDKGRTWTVAETPITAGTAAAGIFSLAFVDGTYGIAVGGDYTKPHAPWNNVALTSDGGATWRLAKGPLPVGYMSGVAYVPGTKGRSLVAVGLGGTARSSDGGESWTMVDSVAYNSVAFASATAGWAVGPRGRIAKWTPAAVGKP